MTPSTYKPHETLLQTLAVHRFSYQKLYPTEINHGWPADDTDAELQYRVISAPSVRFPGFSGCRALNVQQFWW